MDDAQGTRSRWRRARRRSLGSQADELARKIDRYAGQLHKATCQNCGGPTPPGQCRWCKRAVPTPRASKVYVPGPPFHQWMMVDGKTYEAIEVTCFGGETTFVPGHELPPQPRFGNPGLAVRR